MIFLKLIIIRLQKIVWNSFYIFGNYCRKWCASFCRDLNDGFDTEIYDMCDDVHLVCGNILELKWSDNLLITDMKHDEAVELVRKFARKYINSKTKNILYI